MKTTKRAIMRAIEENHGLVTVVAEKLGVEPSTIYDHLKRDPDLKAYLDAQRERSTDFVESKLFEQIEQGNITAIIFYLKTQGKRRGYVERLEIDDRREIEDRAKKVAEERGLDPNRILRMAEEIVSRRA